MKKSNSLKNLIDELVIDIEKQLKKTGKYECDGIIIMLMVMLILNNIIIVFITWC